MVITRRSTAKCMLFGEGTFLLLEKIMRSKKKSKGPPTPEIQKKIPPLLDRLCGKMGHRGMVNSQENVKVTGTQK